jgi:predicted Zn-dependent peptidase
MRAKITMATIAFFLSVSALFAQQEALRVETFTLDNGLTVYLNEDHTMPMIHGMVAVKGGAKRDPKDATGIAHYFEHIMFKGTQDFGTTNYKEEKVYLDSIQNLYEALGATEDKEKREAIQKEINRISIAAADYAIPNEFDKIIKQMGGSNVNAGTSYEFIVYYNSLPSNQIEKWLKVYSNRFEKPVFRLFQSELETVYEEKNMSMDGPMEMMFEKFNQSFFRNTPYGQQTVLGKVEHLKNPSLSKMEDYFNTYYVANNMALVLAGDFKAEDVKPMIEATFGNLPNRPLPKFEDFTEQPFHGREQVKVRMSPIKVGILGFRSIPKNHPDEVAMDVLCNVMSNRAETGLLDQLRNDNKLMFSGLMGNQYSEVGGHYVLVVPKIVGQTLKSAEKHVMAQFEKLKVGDFSDELLDGVKVELQKQYEKNLEDMRWRTYAIMDAFLINKSWKNYLKASKEVESITKEDIVAVANKYFGDDYLAYYSKMGFPKKKKLEKPKFKPVAPKNGGEQSEFAKKIDKMPVQDVEPKFIKFNEDVFLGDPSKGVKTFVTQNPINNIFSIRFSFEKGSYKDKMVKAAVQAFSYTTPNNEDYTAFKQKLQLLGASFYSYENPLGTTVQLEGLEKNFEKTLQVMNDLFANITMNEKELEKLIDEQKTEHRFNSRSLYSKSSALREYALYGEDSDNLNSFTVKEYKKLNVQGLIAKMKEVFNSPVSVHYCGKLTVDDFNNKLLENMVFFSSRSDFKDVEVRPTKEVTENIIYVLHDKKAVQSHIGIYQDGEVNDEASRTNCSAFNDYFGGNMSSIVFQEIREFRSLAYSCGGYYSTSRLWDKPGRFSGRLSTQADKTNEAIEVYLGLLDTMPQKPERIDQVRNNLTLSINSQQSSFRWKSMSVESWKEMGYNQDPREKRYPKYQTMEFGEIMDFYKRNIQGKPKMITIVGNTKKIDLDKLKSIGKVVMLEEKDIFRK